MWAILFLIFVYLGACVAHSIGCSVTNFIRPKGLWMFVPFRVSGWRSHLYPGKVYPIKWVFSKIDFSK